MTIVAIADGVVAIESTVKATTAQDLYRMHPVDRDLADDSMIEEAVRLKKRLQRPLVLLSLAPAAFEKEMRVYMAAGCDRAIRVEADLGRCLDPTLRSRLTAHVLQSQVPDWTIVMVIDRTPGGAAGLMHHHLSESLDAPGFSSVVAVDEAAAALEVRTRASGIIRRYRSDRRVVLGISSRVTLHSPSFMEVHRARKAPITCVDGRSDPAVAQLLEGAGGEVLSYGAVKAPRAAGESAVAVHKLDPDATADRLAELCAPFLPRA